MCVSSSSNVTGFTPFWGGVEGGGFKAEGLGFGHNVGYWGQGYWEQGYGAGVWGFALGYLVLGSKYTGLRV